MQEFIRQFETDWGTINRYIIVNGITQIGCIAILRTSMLSFTKHSHTKCWIWFRIVLLVFQVIMKYQAPRWGKGLRAEQFLTLDVSGENEGAGR